MTTVRLPEPDGTLRPYTLSEARSWPRPERPIACRRAFAAVPVAADPFGDTAPGAVATLDWDATLGFRRHVWSYGLGVAEAMDTAQRGMGLGWDTAAELIQRAGAEARACGGRLVCGAGTDHLTAPSTPPPPPPPPSLSLSPGSRGRADGAWPRGAGRAPTPTPSLDDVVAAYSEQVEVVEAAGAQVVLLASRHLAALARGPEDYAKVYDRLLQQVAEPVILHWLGPMFDPALRGYWGADDLDLAADSLLAIVRDHPGRVDGVKVSLLDPDREVRLRQALPDDVAVYTGDDFHYPELILGDDTGHTDALLGIFAAIAPAASLALQQLDQGDVAGYRAALDPTVPLARHLFAAPTYHYKTGIAFLAWLCGHHRGFTMVGGMASARSVVHLATALRLADAAGLFPDPDLAAHRARQYLAVAGIAP